MTNYKLIKVQDKFILVSDEVIKEDDYKYHHVTGIRKALVDGNYTNQFKIIAGIPELPSIDFSLLSEEELSNITTVNGEVEIEQENLGEIFNGKNSNVMWSDPKPKITNNSIKVVKIL